MFNSDMVDKILINPIARGAQKLLILSGYATPTMDVTNEVSAKVMQYTNFLQKHLKAYEEEIKEAFTFSTHSRDIKIDLV